MEKEVNQSISAPNYGNIAGGDITINQHQHDHVHHHAHTHHGPLVLQTTVVQQVPDFALQAPPAPPARYRARNKQVTQPITPAQKAMLALMRPLPKPTRNALLEWMRCEFGTGLVMELDAVELAQLRQRVAGVNLPNF